MIDVSLSAESVVRNHLQAFLGQKGIAAIVSDYDDDAIFITEERVYRGPRQIGEFFEAFIGSLAPDAFDRFALRRLRVDGDVAYITWSVSPELPLGTDTFLVRDGKIVSQTVAIHAAP